MNDRIRIAFAGTPAFAVPTLERLHAQGVAIDLVLTQPDRPAGRGQKLAPSPVKVAAQALGCRIEQPAALADPAVLADWGAAPDLVVVVAYGLLLPRWLLDWPRVACVNVHASLLPRWRGAAPIQRTILEGDERTGVCLMRMTAGLDCGPVYAAAELAIDPRETAGELHDRLAPLGAELLGGLLPKIASGLLPARTQDEAQATYARKIAKADAPLDWRRPAAELARRVRAFVPWPVAEAQTSAGLRLRIWEAEAPIGATGAAPGEIVAASRHGIDVGTGEGVLRLKNIQPPGGKRMDAAAYLAAHRLDGRFVAP